MDRKDTEELLAIWEEHDVSAWTPEAFEATRIVLEERKVSFSERQHDYTETDSEPDTSGPEQLQPAVSKPVLLAAIGLLIAFFMPWFQLLGFNVSGYNLGSLGSYGNLVWAIPILAGATIWVSLTGRDNRTAGLLTGILPLAGILYGVARMTSEVGGTPDQVLGIMMHLLSIGAYLTIMLSGVIVVAALRPAGLKPRNPSSKGTRPEKSCG